MDVSKVICKEGGLGKVVAASFPAEFAVDAAKAVKATLEGEVVGLNGQELPCEVKDNRDKTFDCSYVPDKKGMS